MLTADLCILPASLLPFSPDVFVGYLVDRRVVCWDLIDRAAVAIKHDRRAEETLTTVG